MTVDLVRPVRRRALRSLRTSRGGRRWPLARVFAVGAALAALIAVAAVGLGAFALWRLSEARTNLIDGAGPALLTAQQLSVALLDQETGVRGFGLTGREEFVQPYRAGVEAQRAAVDTLRGLAAERGLAGIGPELDAVQRAAQEWRTAYAEPVLGAAAGTEPQRGRALFEQVRAATRALIVDLEGQLAAARSEVDASTAFLVGVGVAIAAVLASYLVAAGLGLRRGVLRPVSVLAEQVREVVSGDVQQPVRADGPREIVELGEDVEAMRRHILRDLDDAQAVNRRLDEQARDLERSNRDLEQFAYVASHDLQEPLRKVSSFCQLLQRRYGGQLDERADQYIEFAVDGAQRMQRLINDLLTFSRVGRTAEGFERVELGSVAAAAVAQLDATRAELGGEVVVGELPVVDGDPALLRQLLVNLVGNGLKFHREGVAPVVRVHARRAGGIWEVLVADNGIGIEPEYADKVFVIFQRLHGRDSYPGTGIGLALAKKIVEFHGGRIRLAPADGPGATLVFTLPAAPEEITR
jgi:signal transduction histidine kinase